MRHPVKTQMTALKIISDTQWERAEIYGVLTRAKAQADQTEDDVLARKILEQAISTAFDYIRGNIPRPDPEPGETRGWHEPHAPGEPCPFHDKLNNLNGVIA